MAIKRIQKSEISDQPKSKGSLLGNVVSIESDEKLESSLRPINLAEYIGQDEVKANLRYLIQSSKLRKEALDHVLLHGAPGLGKTTLANIIGHEMGVDVRVTSGPALEKQGDIASIITNLKENDILFIDEIHRLKPAVEEILYSAMEDFAIDLVIGKGPAAKTMRLKLPRFTLIGATTKVSMLSSPLRDRFGAVYRLQFYSEKNVQEILSRSAKLMKVELSDEAAELMARSARQTPRIANRILRRVRDFALVHEKKLIDLKTAQQCLHLLGIDSIGLDEGDRLILTAIIEKFKGGPVGLGTIAAATSEDEGTIEDVYEPYLLQLGLMERTTRGRIITEKAYQHLGFEFNQFIK